MKGTSNYGIIINEPYYGNQVDIVTFSDADWAGSKSDAKSTSGAVVLINKSPVIWSSKKQACVALSTMEAEYIAGGLAVKECLWIKQLLVELSIIKKEKPINLMIDNQSAITNMENEMATARTKHINIRYHFIRKLSKMEILKLLIVQPSQCLRTFLRNR